MKNAMALVFVVALLAGCAAREPTRSLAPGAQPTGVVYIIRDEHFAAGTPMRVGIDGAPVLTIAARGFHRLSLPAGRHTLDVIGGGRHRVDLAAGERRYFKLRVELENGRLAGRLVPVSPERGEAMLARCEEQGAGS